MGYRAKKNYDDLEKLNEATESYFAQQRAALGKTFVFAYIWDVFGKYIAVGGAILMFLIGMLTGWLIRGPGDGNIASSGGPPSLSADAATDDEAEETEPVVEETEATETEAETTSTDKTTTKKKTT
ncbi:MAG: hypothetical protein E7501_08560, partial [Ruminococcus sp.]|nr:hypothetical protein [Ruminococcus sp.]